MAGMSRRDHFPDPETADEAGLVMITRELSTELLMEAYSRGIFPWSENPVRWYCPDPRAILLPQYVRLPKKIGKTMRRHNLRVTFDTVFEQVVQSCADSHAADGVWISEGFVRTYTEFHRMGHAHSVEVWQDDTLVGGLYGVQLGAMFAGESMFYEVSNASKVAFVYLMQHLERIGVGLIDAQVINEHTASLGAVLVRRRDYLTLLRRAVRLPAQYAGQTWPHQPELSAAADDTPPT